MNYYPPHIARHISQTWITNNIYNKYYANFMGQKGSILRTNFYLTTEEYMHLEDNKEVFFNGKRYKSNRPIVDFSPLSRGTYEVELIEIT